MTIEVSLNQIPKALETRLGIPRPDWAVIWDWITTNISESDLHVAWSKLAADWVDHLIASLPAGYSRSDSSEFVLLSNADRRTVERLLKMCEYSRQNILKILDGVARDEGYGKHVVLAFADRDAYYDYVLDYYPDSGEFAHSAGMFLDSGYGHIALCMSYFFDLDRTIAHELSHALIRHLPLPLWLNEGLTQVLEDMVMGSSHFEVNYEMVQRHRKYWNSETIQSFWSGDSFYSPDGQELSYHLSQILFRNLMSDYPKAIKAFLNAAEFADAGNRALIDTCGVSLTDRVSQFLGAGDWSPCRDYSQDDP